MRLQPLLTADETRRGRGGAPGLAGGADGARRRRRSPRSCSGSSRAASPSSAAAGNNGGDGKVCARVLREAGREVTVVEGVGDLGEPDVIVDALLGIGLREAPREDAARMIELINAVGRPVVAVDVPSGVNASTGEVPGAAVRADATVTFGAAKVGLAIAPGRVPRRQRASSRRSGSRPREHEHALVPASALLEVPRKRADSTKYRAGSRARRRRLARADRRADARRARRVPRRRRLRRGRGARVVAAGARGAAARGRQAAAARGRGRAGCSRARPTRSSRRPRRPTPSRSGPGSAAATARVELVRILLERLDAAGRARRGRALGARAVRAAARRRC